MTRDVTDDDWDPSEYDSSEVLRRANKLRVAVTGSFVFIMFIYMTILLSK